MRKLLWLFALALPLLGTSAQASNCSGNPFNLTNGTPADATQVMANFNNLLTCANNNLAHNGANSDITSLSGLSTPLSISQGGTGATSASAALTNLNGASLGANSFTGNQTVTTASNATVSSVTTSTTGSGSVTTINDTSKSTNIFTEGSAVVGTTLGVSNNNLGAITSNATNLAIGTLGGGGNLTIGTNNTAQALFTSGGGLQVGSPTGGDKGAGTLNAQGLYVNGNPLTSGGNLLAVNAYATHGTNTWTRPAGTTFIVAVVVGAGGSGASAVTSTANHSIPATGGGAGCYTVGQINSPASSYTITVGTGGAAPGTGGGAPGTVGNAGTSSSVGSVIVAGGGSGGNIGADVSSEQSTAGVAGGSCTTPGSLLSETGATSGYGLANGSNFCLAGAGGAGPFAGTGQAGIITSAVALGGGAALGPGSGGGGGCAISSGSASNANGGTGFDGYVIIYSYS